MLRVAKLAFEADERSFVLYEGTEAAFHPLLQQNPQALWHLVGEKFKSLLLERDSKAVVAVAAYIDLNPVRAGLCDDSKDYRFCGYAEAVAGNRRAREGLGGVIVRSSWREVSREYRMVLFGAGVMSDRSQEGGIDWAASRAVLKAGGKLPLPELLRLRLRYFSEGVALGSREFIDRLRAEHPGFSGRRRFGEPPPMPADDDVGLRFVRREQARR